MLSLVGVTNFDFVGKQVIASIASIVLIVAGLAAFIMRGIANYDIDFTGGVSVTMQFNEPQQTDIVREKLEKTFNKNITVEELTPFGSTTKGQHFRLRVANEGEGEIEQKDVERKINDTFPGMLVKKTFTLRSRPTAIKAADAVDEAGRRKGDRRATSFRRRAASALEIQGRQGASLRNRSGHVQSLRSGTT